MKSILLLMLICGSVSANPVRCMSQMLYSEARGEGWIGQLAVGHTVLNRMKADNKSACWVINDGYTRKPIPPEDKQYFHEISTLILAGQTQSPIGDRDSFDAYRRRPAWAKHVKGAIRIGGHTYYRRN